MKVLAAVLAVLLVIALVILVPFAIIWSINILFPAAAIPYTLETWVAILLLTGALKANTNVTVKNK